MFDTLIANLAAAPWADTAMALGQVLMIDLVLAGDNAVAVGLAAAGLAVEQRRKVIMAGLAAAVAMRIGFALITTQLLGIIGLSLAGGALAALGLLEDVERDSRPGDNGPYRRRYCSGAGDGGRY